MKYKKYKILFDNAAIHGVLYRRFFIGDSSAGAGTSFLSFSLAPHNLKRDVREDWKLFEEWEFDETL